MSGRSEGLAISVIAALEERVEEALAVARASEAAAVEIGAAALDAAEEARWLAERAGRNGSAPPPPGEVGESFADRADRVAARLQRLQRLPLPA